ncbi:histidinol dehydrogenase [bacterium]|nr:histidinol dehydrogenase [bacterium]MBU1064540.1 histidinol dehydrogenase [bacterium]MBU1633422.1 histidinol dehydrogenase [bacterium]MBU1873352.1 histidinol dehydrogenase [bacterium]
MEVYLYPKREDWLELLKRPQNSAEIAEASVIAILEAVRKSGDAALFDFGRKFDDVMLDDLRVSETEFERASEKVTPELRNAIQLAIDNITKFHKSQLIQEPVVETQPGVRCWRKSVPIEKVGLYIPGGTAPLFSTVLMLAIPAKIAGCSEIVLCTPPAKDGSVNPVILYVAKELGVTKMFKIGGAQAVAAMAYGTENVPRVDKIFGPGNSWVTLAKQLVSRDGVAIDMPAGPSELAVVADETANPEFVAVDLLSQAEHGVDSQVILVTDSEPLVKDVQVAVQRQLQELPRREIAEKALENSRIILLQDSDEMKDFANAYAPEHLIIMTKDADKLAEKVINAGSVFIGAYTPESAGDYASGTNHTLPTYGYARNYSGLSVDSFVKKITFQSLSRNGLQAIGNAIECMAAAEGLDAHKNAVSIRLSSLEKESVNA